MMAAIDKKEKDELNAFELDVIQGSEAYKELEKIVALSTDKQTKMKVDALRGETEMIKAQFGEQSEEYQKHLLRLRQAEEDHRQRSIQNWQTIAGVVSELGDTLESMGGTIGEIGGALSGLARNAGAVTSVLSMKDGEKLSVNEYAAAIQGVIQMVTTLIGASKRRAEAERQFAAARLGFENDYQLALTKKKGDNYNDNPFYQDYEGQIKAGVNQYKDAMDKYQAAIDKLEEGRSKERQKNVVDGKSVGQLAGAGAAAGAVIGGIVGVGVFSAATAAIGAVIGGAVGAIAGLFAKKKKDVFGSLMEQYPELVSETADGWAELNVEMAQALITNGQVDDKTREMLENAIALNEAMQEAKQQIQDTMVDLTGQIGDNLKNALVEAFRAGDSAAQALHQTVGEIISDITSKLLFSALVGPALDQLVKEMTQSLTTGDGAIVDDLTRFDKYGLPAVESYFKGLEEFDRWAKDKGFDDVFGRSQGQSQAMQGVIKGVSEETVSVLIGQTNAIRIYQAQMAFDVRSSLLVLTQISQNTSYNRILVDVSAKLDRMIDQNNRSLRGFGFN